MPLHSSSSSHDHAAPSRRMHSESSQSDGLIARMRSSWLIVLAPITVLLWCVSLSVYRRYAYQRKMWNEGCQSAPKYPHKDPFFGLDYLMILMKGMKQGTAGATATDLHIKYGHTYEHKWFGQRAFCTKNEDNIRTILGPSAGNFIVPPVLRQGADPLLTDNLITLDGPKWKQSRDLIMSVLTKEHAVDLPSLERHIQKLLKIIPRDGGTVDLQPLFQRLFVDRATEYILGESANTLTPDEEPHPEAEKFLSLFEDVLRTMGKRLLLGRMRFLRGRDIQWHKDIATIFATVDKFIDKSIAQKSSSSLSATTTPGFSLVDHYLRETSNKAEVRSQLMSVFFGSRDQIAISMSLLIFALARHPEVWLKLRNEVLANPLNPSTESTARLSYTRNVVYEGLRLYSPVLWSVKHCNTDCILPSGGGADGKAPILVPAGAMVEINIHGLHRDRSIWGESADEFIPERWNNRTPGWKYIPFVAGKRVCPARDLSLTQMVYLLARLVQEFEFLENRDPVVELVDDIRNVRQSRNGVLVALVPTQDLR